MPISFLPVSDHRFKRSPFFACNDRDDTKYSIYNGRLYPISSGHDEKAHYLHLRSKCCLYDVPETPLRITGPNSLAFLQKLFTRDISKIRVGRAGYAVACDYQGGIIMDGVLMRPNEREFIYVQANGDFLNWATAHIGDLNASIRDFDSWVLQIQGPTSLKVFEAVTNISLETFSYYDAIETEICGSSFYVSRSGWSGERGFEIYSKDRNFDGVELWEYLLEKGSTAGLIASDISSMHTRRIEAGILDYGTDIDQTFNPYEIGLGRLVDKEKEDFIGREALVNTKRTALRLLGIKCEKTFLTRGDKLFEGAGSEAGFVSAGGWSPYLKYGVGLIRLNESRPPNYQLRISTSSGEFEGEVVQPPFYDPSKLLAR